MSLASKPGRKKNHESTQSAPPTQASPVNDDRIEALRSHLAAIVESSDDAIISDELDGTIISWNRGAARMFGYTATEIIGHPVSVLVPSERLDEERATLHQLRHSERETKLETERLAKDGRAISVSMTVSPVKDSSGRVIGAFRVLRDLAGRKHAEQALLDSEDRFRTIADTIPQMVWTTTADGAADYFNARWYEYTGQNPGEANDWGWKHTVHPEDLDAVIATWTGCLRTGAPYDIECRFKRGEDGAYRWFLIRGLAVRDPTGPIKQWIGTCTDIDEQKHSVEIEAARARAEAANRAKSEFLANMSHEIRTPMTAILGYADQLLDVERTASDRNNAVNVIRRNGAHLLAVINDILDLSKIEAGEMLMESIPCSLCEILADVASPMQGRARERGLKFELMFEGAVPEFILTDPTRLRQILINLTGNAVKFTEAGWVRLVAKMDVAAKAMSPRLRFEIIDSGIGLSAEQRARLFQPFAQADSSTTRRFGGTGLGLTISQRLAKELGGEITVDSMPGRGSLFAVTVATGPLTGVRMLSDIAEVLTAMERPASMVNPLAVRLQGRVLLAEDGLDNQDLLCGYLRRAGAEVLVAENGQIACDMVSESKLGFDLILMDMQMPVLDGYAAASKLRSRGYRGPIVALTAHAMATDRTRCLQAGCTDYLSKPIKSDTLLGAVHRHLAASRALGGPGLSNEVALGQCLGHGSDDEVLTKHMPAFLARLPIKIRTLETRLAEGNVAEIAMLAHALAGSAGMYQFVEVSKSASSIESAILQGAALESIAAQVRGLVGLVRGIRGYDHTKEPIEIASL